MRLLLIGLLFFPLYANAKMVEKQCNYQTIDDVSISQVCIRGEGARELAVMYHIEYEGEACIYKTHKGELFASINESNCTDIKNFDVISYIEFDLLLESPKQYEFIQKALLLLYEKKSIVSLYENSSFFKRIFDSDFKEFKELLGAVDNYHISSIRFQKDYVGVTFSFERTDWLLALPLTLRHIESVNKVFY